MEAGLDPVCVASCPSRALEFGDIDELRAAYGDVAAIAPLPAPDQTGPSVVIAPCHNAEDCGAEGLVVNEPELV